MCVFVVLVRVGVGACVHASARERMHNAYVLVLVPAGVPVLLLL